MQKVNHKRLAFLIGAGLLIGLGIGIFFFAGLSGLRSAEAVGLSDHLSQPAAPEVGKLAPDFELETISGNQVKLSDLQGKPVLINFWATWCEPCKVEMPMFEERHQQLGSELAVIAVNASEPAGAVLSFVDEFNLTFDILLDPKFEAQNLYLVRGFPTTIFVDDRGTIHAVHLGVLSESQMDGYLQELGVLDS